jgi:hypothetical protein
MQIDGLPDVSKMENLLPRIHGMDINLMISRIAGAEQLLDHMIRNMRTKYDSATRSIKLLNMTEADTSTLMKEITEKITQTIEFDFM